MVVGLANQQILIAAGRNGTALLMTVPPRRNGDGFLWSGAGLPPRRQIERKAAEDEGRLVAIVESLSQRPSSANIQGSTLYLKSLLERNLGYTPLRPSASQIANSHQSLTPTMPTRNRKFSPAFAGSGSTTSRRCAAGRRPPESHLAIISGPRQRWPNRWSLKNRPGYGNDQKTS